MIACPSLVFPGPNDIYAPILRAHHAKEFEILADSSLSPSAQTNAVVTNYKGILVFIKRTLKTFTPMASFFSIPLWLTPS